MAYTVKINGVDRTVDVDGDMPLLWVRRDELDLKGSKFGSCRGCAACTVHLDRVAVGECQTSVSGIGKAATATIDGMADDPVERRLQATWTHESERRSSRRL